MGAGYHGGFGQTAGSKLLSAAGASSAFVGPRAGDNLKLYAARVKAEDGYTDVVIHGNADTAEYFYKGKWIYPDHRSVALMLKKDVGYKLGAIRLLSCSAGKKDFGFAQNLANKMGVPVKAPTDTLWVWPNGRITIGPNQFTDTGTWRVFKPKKKGSL